ncbi:hypothetical protein JYU34_018329 [Plutella xylostella]|uniref:Uncharacterized protein n=1 Tax=Plutella xylostella TaxID=51655 RepID=A0ABQ7PXK3_PLUXY|nr:ribonuclease P protein subunit rpr2 [Plutella xylostella]KAG7297616.1 hypothetical protein JYU34_018329 [Plutella xylostella]
MKKIQGNDSFQRINYLYQLSKELAKTNRVLSSYYGNLMTSVAKKNVLKIHPDIKRQSCKKCKCSLIEKVSANRKIKKTSNKQKFLHLTCSTCDTQKKFPLSKKKNHRVWVEKPESVVDGE